MKGASRPRLHALIIVCAALSMGSGALAAVPEYDIRAACAEAAAGGGGSKVIELECRKQENAAGKRLEKNPLREDVLATCDAPAVGELASLTDGDSGFVDWPMRQPTAVSIRSFLRRNGWSTDGDSGFVERLPRYLTTVSIRSFLRRNGWSEIARATGAGSSIILEECARQEQDAAAQLD